MVDSFRSVNRRWRHSFRHAYGPYRCAAVLLDLVLQPWLFPRLVADIIPVEASQVAVQQQTLCRIRSGSYIPVYRPSSLDDSGHSVKLGPRR